MSEDPSTVQELPWRRWALLAALSLGATTGGLAFRLGGAPGLVIGLAVGLAAMGLAALA